MFIEWYYDLMNKSDHLYFLVLQVASLVVKDRYDILPAHCTLMHRFWSELPPEQLGKELADTLMGQQTIKLNFKEEALLGPNKVAVNKINMSRQLRDLHSTIYEKLNSLGVEYTAPEWVGNGYVAHVSKRDDSSLGEGDIFISTAICLVEVDEEGHRNVRQKFDLQ
jgi:hypothetical protein